MAVGGINTSYVLPGGSASLPKMQSTGEIFSISNWLAQNSAAPTYQTQSYSSAVQAADKDDAVPAGFEDMAERVAQMKQQVEDLIAEAREATGFQGRIAQGATDVLYGLGSYQTYDSLTGKAQWYNEDGSMRDEAPSPDESLEQAKLSAPKAQAHKQYMTDNGFYEILGQLAQEETILDYARQNKEFQKEYLSDPEAALARYSQQLGSHRSQYGLRQGGGGDNPVLYGANPMMQIQGSTGQEIPQRIDIMDLLRTARQSAEQSATPELSSFLRFSTSVTSKELHWWRT